MESRAWKGPKDVVPVTLHRPAVAYWGQRLLKLEVGPQMFKVT